MGVSELGRVIAEGRFFKGRTLILGVLWIEEVTLDET